LGRRQRRSAAACSAVQPASASLHAELLHLSCPTTHVHDALELGVHLQAMHEVGRSYGTSNCMAAPLERTIQSNRTACCPATHRFHLVAGPVEAHSVLNHLQPADRHSACSAECTNAVAALPILLWRACSTQLILLHAKKSSQPCTALIGPNQPIPALAALPGPNSTPLSSKWCTARSEHGMLAPAWKQQWCWGGGQRSTLSPMFVP